MSFTENLNQIINRKDLSQDNMASMFMDIFSGNITDAQIGAFMAALATKKETFEELAGAARTMKRKAVRIQTTSNTVVDTCGTGGDATGTFNISTTTAFVVAGCGVNVAKHGNRSISSQCGSADLLEELGVNINTDPEIVEEAVNDIGIGFLFAPRFHGSMRHAGKARKDVGIRSIFNMLGPLTNPAAAKYQLIGVYAPDLTEMFAQTLKLLGTTKAFVVHGHDGMDEITTTAPTRVTELNKGIIKTYDLDPLKYFNSYSDPKDLKGGDKKINAAITKSILKGMKGAKRDIVLINTAAALFVSRIVNDLSAGIKMAKDSIDSGKANEKLNELVEFTKDNG
ncbi:MAG: anthranilate phosphoribosyltransferase [Desulfobacteraceae bacterium]|nr:anthranilate phosphoribosyltransferase [Desulfobacteraceae bacterium]